jgi:hypothetical protein
MVEKKLGKIAVSFHFMTVLPNVTEYLHNVIGFSRHVNIQTAILATTQTRMNIETARQPRMNIQTVRQPCMNIETACLPATQPHMNIETACLPARQPHMNIETACLPATQRRGEVNEVWWPHHIAAVTWRRHLGSPSRCSQPVHRPSAAGVLGTKDLIDWLMLRGSGHKRYDWLIDVEGVWAQKIWLIDWCWGVLGTKDMTDWLMLRGSGHKRVWIQSSVNSFRYEQQHESLSSKPSWYGLICYGIMPEWWVG